MRRAILLCSVAACLLLPAAPAARAAPMTVPQARRLVAETLRYEYRASFSLRTLSRSCDRLTTVKVRCRVRWRKWPFRYSGPVTVWYAGPDHRTFTYAALIQRTNIRRRRPDSSRRSRP